MGKRKALKAIVSELAGVNADELLEEATAYGEYRLDANGPAARVAPLIRQAQMALGAKEGCGG